ncbi:alpha/beta hydrolase [Thermoflavimicrobium daqui]|uniref:Alpha/beta hydrolase n=1 Tax=Thermoflavimicrobium daqui TaxID=2137476 RepID=A0A364K0T0_9BACL|nr:alpha/beta hydrolase [Thermoflavimicrobium daqui]RAL21030.1 alpha/beta hydrolase [Thermoflavimicrobium daqui]
MSIDIQVEKLLTEIYTHMARLNHPPLNELTPEMSRFYFQEGRKFYKELFIPNIKEENKYISDLEYRLPIRIYTPEGTGPFPILVYFHGGGWVLGDLDSSDHICRYMAHRSKSVVISVGYRLAPEYKYPKPFEDAVYAIQWIYEHIHDFWGDPSRFVVGGESAGANLAAAASIKFKELGFPYITGQLLITPVTHYSFDTESYQEEGTKNLTKERMIWFWHHYLEDPSQGLEPYSSPLLVKDASNLPPALIVTVAADPLRDEGAAFANRLKRDGVCVKYMCFEGLVHSFIHMIGSVELARQAFDQIIDALKQMVLEAPVQIGA